jgi:RNA polymerase sigma factor (sigma-70 family)
MHLSSEQTDKFISLIKDQERLIFKVCCMYAERGEDRKDIFQEIVLQAWSAYPRFKNTAKASTWLYRIALNTAINYQRKNNRLITVSCADFLSAAADDISASPAFDDEYRLMHQFISGLPALEKALVMLYLDEYSYQEIADIMGLSQTNVGTKLMRIKEKLKSQAHEFIRRDAFALILKNQYRWT